MDEIWESVVGFEGIYMVSNLGRIKSLQRTVHHPKSGRLTIPERILKLSVNKKGFHNYPMVNLHKNGKQKLCTVHRIVANAFLQNPEKKREVNHLNGLRHDNRAANLKWVTPSENCFDAWGNGTKKRRTKYVIPEKIIAKSPSRTVEMYTREGIFIRKFSNATEATKITGCHLSHVLSGERKHSKGYFFKYSEEVH